MKPLSRILISPKTSSSSSVICIWFGLKEFLLLNCIRSFYNWSFCCDLSPNWEVCLFFRMLSFSGVSNDASKVFLWIGLFNFIVYSRVKLVVPLKRLNTPENEFLFAFTDALANLFDSSLDLRVSDYLILISKDFPLAFDPM